MSVSPRTVIEPGAGDVVRIGGMDAVSKIPADVTDGLFAIVEHPLAPSALAGPPHTHANEDEYSLVLEGEVGFRIGDEEFVAGSGAYVTKPRGVPHAFWNPGTDPARVVEIISPAGFEQYFTELAAILASGPLGGEPDFGAIMALGARYGLTFHMEQLPDLVECHNLRLG